MLFVGLQLVDDEFFCFGWLYFVVGIVFLVWEWFVGVFGVLWIDFVGLDFYC